MTMTSPHAKAEWKHSGTDLRSASSVMLLLHGRGGTATDILNLGEELALMGMALLAPQAAENTWYPYSFLAPRQQNEPWLSSALEMIEAKIVKEILPLFPSDNIVLCGFSQGACLASEFVASHPRRYGALVAFTGGLIGAPGTDLHHPGTLAGTPVLLSSGDPDPHVPWVRVEETEAILKEMGASVESSKYSGRPHTILPVEVREARGILQRLSPVPSAK